MKFVLVLVAGIILSAVAHPIGRMLNWNMKIRHLKSKLEDILLHKAISSTGAMVHEPSNERVPFKKIPKGVHSALHGVFDLYKFYAQDKDHCLAVKAKCTDGNVPCCSVEKYKDGEIYVIEQVCYT